MKTFFVGLAASAVLALAVATGGCLVQEWRYSQIRPGMTQDEVITCLGEPTFRMASRVRSAEDLCYKGFLGDDIIVTIQAGKVPEKRGALVIFEH